MLHASAVSGMGYGLLLLLLLLLLPSKAIKRGLLQLLYVFDLGTPWPELTPQTAAVPR